jgi:hypothetical protein
VSNSHRLLSHKYGGAKYYRTYAVERKSRLPRGCPSRAFGMLRKATLSGRELRSSYDNLVDALLLDIVLNLSQ